MCGITAAQGLFARLRLPAPFPSPYESAPLDILESDTSDPINVLVYGSSTSLGLYAAQLVRLTPFPAGRKLRLIGTASPKQHDALAQAPYSYDALVDYRDHDWPEKVRHLTGGKGIDIAIDCISGKGTVGKVHDLLSQKGMLAVFLGPFGDRYDPSKMRVKPAYGVAWEALGETIGYDGACMILLGYSSKCVVANS